MNLSRRFQAARVGPAVEDVVMGMKTILRMMKTTLMSVLVAGTGQAASLLGRGRINGRGLEPGQTDHDQGTVQTDRGQGTIQIDRGQGTVRTDLDRNIDQTGPAQGTEQIDPVPAPDQTGPVHEYDQPAPALAQLAPATLPLPSANIAKAIETETNPPTAIATRVPLPAQLKS